MPACINLLLHQFSNSTKVYKGFGYSRRKTAVFSMTMVEDGTRIEAAPILLPEGSWKQGAMRGKVVLSFEDNPFSKIGVRFDKAVPGGVDLGDICEPDHGFFCNVNDLRLENPGMEDLEKMLINILFEGGSKGITPKLIIVFHLSRKKGESLPNEETTQKYNEIREIMEKSLHVPILR